MAARNRRRTAWYGCDTGVLTLTGLGNGETVLLGEATDDSPPTGSTLVRIVGTITMTATRTSTGGSTSAPENAIVRLGLMVASQTQTLSAPDLDLDDRDTLSDERWLWIQTRTHRVGSVFSPYWNGSAQVDRYANVDAGQFPYWDVDVRAKRRWEDPVTLSLHAFAVGEVAAVSMRPALRALFKLP